ncbi:phycobilisome rod-core linker polypeptide [Okeanomitos corallinicola TIOX110]|uniref:Phycobilisome rod-core linker polypeptide n=1 Tax=Okeanomitos corallinicola TIOX110 TaxID=3133117 RepID=A0ABZ2USH5_9CYAN
MTLPLLKYAPSSQNQRVKSFEIPGDEQPRIYTTEGTPDTAEIDDLIWAAYRQIFNEQQILKSNRLVTLESQLKHRSITVRDFIKGLLMSETFRLRNYNTNNNYRFVEMCIQRVLGRKVYNQQETMAWSVVIGTKGIQGFVDALLNSEEYQTNFGDNTVPYQRRRIIAQHSVGELPFSQFPRYDQYHLQQLEDLGYFQAKPSLGYLWKWQQPPYNPAYLLLTSAVWFVGNLLILSAIVYVILGYYGVFDL